MKKTILTLAAIILGAAVFFVFIGPEKIEAPGHITTTAMQLTSPAFKHNQFIPAKYTCDGENINPTLNFIAPPAETKSFVLIVDDPDAPSGTWVHWTLWNIAPGNLSIAENSTPPNAIAGKPSFGKPGYGGPCPPSGTHRYFFKLYALDVMLDLSQETSATDLKAKIKPHILDQAELIGLYARQ